MHVRALVCVFVFVRECVHACVHGCVYMCEQLFVTLDLKTSLVQLTCVEWTNLF